MNALNIMGYIAGIIGQIAITLLGLSLQSKLTASGFLSPLDGVMLGCGCSSLGWAVNVTLQNLTED